MKKKNNRYRSVRSGRKGLIRGVLKTVLGVSFTVVLVVLLSAGLSHSYHALMESSWLRVNEIEVTGLKHLERDDILKVLSIPEDAGLFNLKASHLARRLETVPQLRSAVVRLDPPGRVVVEISEREPIANVQLGEPMLLDTEGRLFPRAGYKHCPDLLLVTGFTVEGLVDGDRLATSKFEMLKELLAALEKSKSWLPLNQITECQWHAGGFVLFTASKSTPVRLGSDRFSEKLDRLQRLFGALEGRKWMDMVTRIDLDYPNRAYVEGTFPESKGS